MENFDNYFDEGSSLNKLATAIDTIDDLSSICSESNCNLTANTIARPLQLAVLRLQQIYKELEAEKQEGANNE